MYCYLSTFLQIVALRRDAQSKEQQIQDKEQQIRGKDQQVREKDQDLQHVQQQVFLTVVQCFNFWFGSQIMQYSILYYML